jgi:hypothetical protein
VKPPAVKPLTLEHQSGGDWFQQQTKPLPCEYQTLVSSTCAFHIHTCAATARRNSCYFLDKEPEPSKHTEVVIEHYSDRRAKAAKEGKAVGVALLGWHFFLFWILRLKQRLATGGVLHQLMTGQYGVRVAC